MPCTEESLSEEDIDPMEEPLEVKSSAARHIFITRHGESINNLYGKIGGDADLSPRGEQYAKALGLFINNLNLKELDVWVTEYRRTVATARYVKGIVTVQPGLNEINAGDHDDLTYEEIAEQFPQEFALRDADKLRYRYPNGESYMDVLERLKPVMVELERKENLLIVSHQATLRCVLPHFLETELEDVPYTKVPLHTVIKVTREDDEDVLEYYRLPVDSVDTYRPKPNNCDINRNKEEACGTIPYHL